MNTLEKKIFEILSRAVEHHEAAGYNVLVRQDGEQIAYAEAGYADIEANKPIRRESIFRLYSQSKPITAAAAMILIERGLIDVADPVEDYLPGFSNPRVVTGVGKSAPAVSHPLIRDLLAMTAGLSYPGEDEAGRYAATLFSESEKRIVEGCAMDTVELANAIGKLPMAFEPGTQFRYSTCADVLGAVIEVVSGKPFGQFLKEELFDPLGMKDTAFWVPQDKQTRFVTTYRRTSGGLVRYESQHLSVGIYDKEPAFASGGAGLVSTLDDYARFAQMLLNGGELDGQRILGRATVDWMTCPQITTLFQWDTLPGFGYGKLMRICVEPGRALGLASKGEYGWDGWLGTYFANFPTEHLTLLLGQNTVDAGTTSCTRKVRNAVLSSVI